MAQGGEIYGIWSFFHENGEKKYKGQCQEGMEHGHGISFNESGQKEYEGQWQEGKRHGQGTSFFYGKKMYEGQWQEGKEYGYGTSFSCRKGARSGGITTYEGQWQEGKRHGHGTSFRDNGKKMYEGQWQEGKEHGYGIFFIHRKGRRNSDRFWSYDGHRMGRDTANAPLLHSFDTYEDQWKDEESVAKVSIPNKQANPFPLSCPHHHSDCNRWLCNPLQ